MPGSNCTQDAAGPQEQRLYLIGTIKSLHEQMRCCPTASSLRCRDDDSDYPAIIAIPCKRWGCRFCGVRKAYRLALMVEVAAPERFITLTVTQPLFETPRQCYDRTRRQVGELVKRCRKKLGTFEYLKVLEATKKGWPHYHLLARCPFVRQDWLSEQWAELTGAKIVDVRRVEKVDNVFKYVMKYLCKQTYIPWTNRRISWSKGFFPKAEKKEKTRDPFNPKTRDKLHPSEVLSRHYQGQIAVEKKNGVWVIVPSDDIARGLYKLDLQKEAGK